MIGLCNEQKSSFQIILTVSYVVVHIGGGGVIKYNFKSNNKYYYKIILAEKTAREMGYNIKSFSEA